jgi:magnesium-transporting ATPase (P-type)
VRVLSTKVPLEELNEKRIYFKQKFPNFNTEFPNCFDIKKSQDIKVGNVVLVQENEIFPANLILLGTAVRIKRYT